MLAQLAALRAELQAAIADFCVEYDVTDRIEIASVEFESSDAPTNPASAERPADRIFVLLRNDKFGRSPGIVGNEVWHKFVESTVQAVARRCMNDDRLVARTAAPMMRIAVLRGNWSAPDRGMVWDRLDNNLRMLPEDTGDLECPCCESILCRADDRTFKTLIQRIAIEASDDGATSEQ